MSTATTTRPDIDSSLLDALGEVQESRPAREERADGWVPPTQRRLSAPPLATSLPIRGAGDTMTDAPLAESRYRMPRPSATPPMDVAPIADPIALVDVTFEQVRAEGLDWLRDLARRKAS